MDTSSIRIGDIVEVNHLGRVFLAFVDGRSYRELKVAPITPGITWRTAKAQEITDHWRRRRRRTPA